MENDVIFIFSAATFFIWTIRSVFYWVYIFQRYYYSHIKSLSFVYRIRRIISLFLSFSSIFTWLSIVLSLLFLVNDFPNQSIQLLILILFVGKSVIVMKEVIQGEFKKPELNVRNLTMIILSLCMIAIFFAFPLTERYLWLLFLDRFLFFIVAFVVFLITFPGEIFDDFQIRRATKKLSRYGNLHKVIIFGENSSDTAQLTYELIRRHFRTVLINSSLPGSGNVAQKIIAEMTERTEMLVHALRPGDNKINAEILQIIKPETLIITDKVDERRLLSFIQFAENSIPKNSRIIISARVASKVKHILKKKKIIQFSPVDTRYMTGTVFVDDIRQYKDYLSALVRLPRKDLKIKVPFIGKFLLDELIPALVIADQLGLHSGSVNNVFNNFPILSSSVIPHKLHSGTVVLDASRVYQPVHVQEIVSYLNLYKKKKIFVLGLGDDADSKEVISIGRTLSDVRSILYFLDAKYQQRMRKTIRSQGKCQIRSSPNKEIIRTIREDLSKGDIVVFLGPTTIKMIEHLLTHVSTKT